MKRVIFITENVNKFKELQNYLQYSCVDIKLDINNEKIMEITNDMTAKLLSHLQTFKNKHTKNLIEFVMLLHLCTFYTPF